MESLAMELDSALAAVEKEGDCGCGGKKSDGGMSAAEDGLAAELEAALDAVEAEDVFGGAPEEDPFSDLAMAAGVGLDDIVAVVERHPGLKICISF
jgi:hypothetical protein